MITIYSYTFFLIYYIVNRKNYYSPISLILFLVMGVKVILPMLYVNYRYANRDLIDSHTDLIACLSIVLIILVSLKRRKKCSFDIPTVEVNRGVLYFIFVAGIILQLAPSILEAKILPVYYLFKGEPGLAHEARLYFTKHSNFSFMIDISQRLLLPISIVLLAANNSKIMLKRTLLFIALVVSSAYFQKASPINLLVIYVLSLLMVGKMSVRNALLFSLIILAIIYMFALSFGVGNAKFYDLIFRRMMYVPIHVFSAYMEYGNEYGPIFLQNSFTSLRGSSEPPLPMLIYQYMDYGGSKVGWANGMYIGDLFVNFGLIGVLIFSLLIGVFVRGTAEDSRKVRSPILRLFSALFAFVFIYYLGNNALFSTTIMMFMLLSLIFFRLSKYRIIWRR